MEQDNLTKDLQPLSGYVYQNKSLKKPDNWIEINSYSSSKTGMYAATFIKNNQLVISFRGTDKYSSKDIINDIELGMNLLPAQIISAQKYYKDIKNKFPNYEITLTGHSLGGSLAQIIGSQTGDKTITFGAYGTGSILNSQIKHTGNITNYGNVNDPIFASNIKNQIGNSYIITDSSLYEEELVKGKKSYKPIMKKHYIENIGDLSKASLYRGQNLQIEGKTLLKAHIEKNVNYRDFDKKRVLTNEGIGEMSKEEFIRNENFINQQLNLGNIMPKSKADELLSTGHLIWIAPYTREDGTQVCGYYRRK